MHLLIVFLTAIIIASVGFIMYVYFFSVGYGFSIAGIGIVLLIMLRANITPATIIMCLLFIIYGARLGGYLLYRELKSTAYKKLLKGESKSNVCSISARPRPSSSEWRREPAQTPSPSSELS